MSGMFMVVTLSRDRLLACQPFRRTLVIRKLGGWGPAARMEESVAGRVPVPEP